MGILNKIMNQESFDVKTSLDYIKEYEQVLPFDSEIHTARAVTYFFAEEYELAEEHIRKALKFRPNNYDNNFYLANILIAKGKYSDAIKAAMLSVTFLKHFAKISGYDYVNEKLVYANEQVKNIIDYCIESIKDTRVLEDLKRFLGFIELSIAKFPACFYNNKWNVIIEEYLNKNSSSKYNDYLCFYSDKYNNLLADFQKKLCTVVNNPEIYSICPIEGFKSMTTKEFNLDNGKYIIPIATTEYNQVIDFKIRTDNFKSQQVDPPGFFKYYRVNNGVSLKSDKDVIVGKPIELGFKENNKKLVFTIFIDALSQQYLSETKYKSMPYTKAFFKKGIIFKNCYSTGEWTYPSLTSVLTGLYTTNHHFLHSSAGYKYPEDIDLFSEIMKKNEYFTANISGTYAFASYSSGFRGFDRTVFKNSLGFSDSQIINDAIEHIESFKETNQFVFISLSDVHKILDDIENYSVNYSIVNQTSLDIETSLSKRSPFVSAWQKYDEEAIKKYDVALKELDRQLKGIYDYILQNYSEEEYLISIFSDHGASFLGKDDFLLKSNITNSVLMVRGSGSVSNDDTEYISNMDLIPITLKLANIEHDLSKYDCVLPKTLGGKGREFTYSESIYPGQTYKAMVNNDKYCYILETKDITNIDGTINFDEYSDSIFDKKEGKEVKDNDILEYYREIVYNHIKRNIKY
ncbi:sulfatase-like hydrolase/transferase [Clostridioides sp. GD02377]|uniref:sulfatase-like hydrolase/transferase n=1 Tax=unclassified Clostridioides TaxID=2635829 RepID=UPI0038A31709